MSTLRRTSGPAANDDGADTGVERLAAPGLVAALRRHPGWLRNGAIGAIATGAVLFVIASLTTPVAGADTHPGPAIPSTGTRLALPELVPDFPTPTATITTAAPTKRLTAKPVMVAKKAPIAPVVISGLAANGIPTVALNAYRVAADRLAHVDPSCGIGWALLAGIGREESDHGRFGGAVLHADGTSSPRIIGPALDGKRWDLIGAPKDGLALDGDAVYAHALGPMQFIPSTWAGYGADANGDGVADIFNINDAALGAARYLCAAGGNLRTVAGQTRAVLAYNHSDAYLAQVLALANDYRKGISITGIPVGNITGALPAVRKGAVPPANPGDPTAVQPVHKAAPATAAPPKSAKAAPTKAATNTVPGKGTPAPGTSSTAPDTGGGSGKSSSGSPTSKPAPSGSTTPPSGGSSSAPPSSPSPSPSKTCHLAVGKLCIVP